MKFFIDENSHRQIGDLLRQVYPGHQYVTVDEEDLSGVEDVPLFSTLAQRGYDALITADRKQLVNPEERAALIAAKLHWIGHTRAPAKGPAGIAYTCSGVIAGFPHILKHLTDGVTGPTSFNLKGIGSELGQRVTINLL